MPEFQITIRNEKRKSYKISFFVIIFLNLLAFLFLAYISKNNSSRKVALLAAEMIAISLALHFLIKNKKRFDFKWPAIAIAVFFYLRLYHYWSAITLIILSLLYLIAVRDLIVYISDTIISIPTFPKKKASWKELNNIILKDEVLTIDFKSNSLIQHRIDQSKTSLNEQEFNEFCKEQLRRAGSST